MRQTTGYLVLVHCICWLVFISLPVLFISSQFGASSSIPGLSSWFYFALYILVFYLHTFYLLPQLYFKKRQVLYFITLFAMLVIVFFLRPFDRVIQEIRQQHFKTGYLNANPKTDAKTNFTAFPKDSVGGPQRQFFQPERNPVAKLDIVSLTLFIMVITVSLSIVVVKRWRIAVEKVAEAEAEKVRAELSMLKAQINPHFLFNTLNNIYSLALAKEDKTPESILKLSNIMRYVTDEATNQFVSLSKEANFISDYIALQRLRLGSKVSLYFSLTGSLTNKTIAPLILITFIENVFKYGTSNNQPCSITIELATTDDSILFFSTNQIFLKKNQTESTGIGIMNTRKRLEHLYPGKYDLQLSDEGGYFSVNLVLHL